MIHLKIMFYGLLVFIGLAIASAIMYACGHVISKIFGWDDQPSMKWLYGILFASMLATIYFMGCLAYYG